MLKIPAFGNTRTVIAQCKKPTTQMAHLVFAYTRANARKTKRAIFFPTLDKKLLRNKRHLKNYCNFVKK